MRFFQVLIMAAFIGLGIYYLFEAENERAVYYLLIGLYFFVSYLEMLGRPFSRGIYLIVFILLSTNGIVSLFFLQPAEVFSGLISLFLAIMLLQSYRRIRRISSHKE
ncbi:hypothetical protein IC620_00120 [Hazenella sp. IB182357]|uniref:Uncharacterized protein n=1 Tax=Polycladospora coralii TaxID=2771432 RepID=A0A926N8L0_9BACL|nr:hypothetical protein [Polycladospora coralii]MBD1370765.1 hypothetical protein [Polycladospora coralii]MBS7529703.1 hypothetical protein [Polycladospora coralii]